MSEIAAIIVAIGGTLGPLGLAGAFVWRKIDKRVNAAEAKVQACEAHRESDKNTIARLIFEVRRDGKAVRLLFDELHRVEPKSVTLRHVGVVLREQWRIDVGIPDDWSELVSKLDEFGSARKAA